MTKILFFIIFAVSFLNVYNFLGIYENVNYMHDSVINRIKRKVPYKEKYKWNIPISFFIDESVNKRIVLEAIEILELETCINFKRYKTKFPERTGLRYFYGSKCDSDIGKRHDNVWQNISIGKNCDSLTVVLHETLHALGFDHEHNRHDRGKYVHYSNKDTESSNRYNFKKVRKSFSNTFNIPYDYASIMHYKCSEFSKTNGKNLLPHDMLYETTLGSGDDMSFNDIKLLNFFYCSKSCLYTIKCYNGGFQNPNNCKLCKCVEGFIGNDCSRFIQSTLRCGNSIIMVGKKISTLKINGYKDCIYHLIADKNNKIIIEIRSLNFYLYRSTQQEKYCFSNSNIEIKFFKDKTVTGARFCILNKNILITSHNNHVIVYYRSNFNTNYAGISYVAQSDLPKTVLSKKSIFKKIISK